MLRRTIVVLLCLGMTLAMASIPVAIGEEKQPVHLTFWGYDGAPEYTDLFKKYIEQYKAIAPNVTIEYLGLPFESAMEKFNMAVATGTSPDIAFIGCGWGINLAHMNALASLDDYFENSELKGVAERVSFDTGVVDGVRYGIPIDNTLLGTWYRSDWYGDLGLEVPRDFDTFFSNISSISNSGKAHGFALRGGFGGSYQLEGFLVAYAGAESYYDEQGRAFLRDEKVLEGLKRYVGLYKRDTAESDINNTYKDMANAFGTGAAGTLFHNISSGPLHEKNLGPGKYGFFILPEADNGNRTVAMCGVAATSLLTMFNTTKHPEEAWAFMEYLLSDEVHSDWTQTLGLFPCTTSVLGLPWVQENSALAYCTEVLKEENINYIRVPFHIPDFDAVHINTLQPALQEVLAEKMTPDDFMELFIEEMETIYAEYQK